MSVIVQGPVPLPLLTLLTEKAGVLPWRAVQEAAVLAGFTALACNWCAVQGANCSFPDCSCAGDN